MCRPLLGTVSEAHRPRLAATLRSAGMLSSRMVGCSYATLGQMGWACLNHNGFFFLFSERETEKKGLVMD